MVIRKNGSVWLILIVSLWVICICYSVSTSNKRSKLLLTTVNQRWSSFIAQFMRRRLLSTVMFSANFGDIYWNAWLRNVIPSLSIESPNSIYLLPLLNQDDNSNLSKNAQILNKFISNQVDLLIVSPFWSRRDVVLVEKMVNMYDSDHVNLLLVSSENMIDLIRTISFKHLNQITLVQSSSNGLNLWEVYQIDPSMEHTIVEAGQWIPKSRDHTANMSRSVKSAQFQRYESSSGVLEIFDGDIVSRRLDMQGKILECVSLPYPPFSTQRKEKDGKLVYGGWLFNIMEIIEARSNFTLDCREPIDGAWGALENGSWIGMVGELHRREAEVAIASLDHTLARSKAMDYTIGLYELGYRNVIKRPRSADATWSSFVMELTPEAWATVLFSTVAFTISLSIVMYATSNEKRFCMSECFMIVIGSFSGNGLSEKQHKKHAAYRLILFTIYATNMVVLIHYTTFLMVSLTVNTASPPFTTLQGMLDMGGYSFGFQRDISLIEHFQKPNPLYQQMWKSHIEKEHSSYPVTNDEGIRMVKQENYVFMIGTENFLSAYGHDCKVMLLPESYIEVSSAFGVQKGSHLRKVLNYHVARLRDSGVLEKLWSRWREAPVDCSVRGQKTVLAMKNIMVAFLLLATAAIASLIFIGCEKIVRDFQNRRKLKGYSKGFPEKFGVPQNFVEFVRRTRT